MVYHDELGTIDLSLYIALCAGNSSGRQQRSDPATTPASLRNADSCEATGGIKNCLRSIP
ncbi:MAG: hypothetical protein F6K24_12780 [Okeania sp. SIO2D1]|nr:hypothetical protein [Okeania sp. SIO2D1]